MTQEETEIKTKELIKILKPKYQDISVHIDLVPGTENINISLFWNRKSRDIYNESKNYRIKSSDYVKLFNEEIMKLL